MVLVCWEYPVVWALEHKPDAPGEGEDDASETRTRDVPEEAGAIRCRECALHLANPGDVFSRTPAGSVGIYVNPALYLHEVLTVTRAQGLVLEGEPTAAHSWFGGYAWTIAMCGRCGFHIGWRYDAVESGVEPGMFWGLSRAAIRVTNSS